MSASRLTDGTLLDATALNSAADELTLTQYAEAVEEASEHLVSVIVPVENDKRYLQGCFDRLAGTFAGSTYAYEILVVDDHSTDGTEEFVRASAKSFPVRYIGLKNARGRARSIKAGLDASTGAVVVVIDPHLRCPRDSFWDMFAALGSAQIVVANRAKYPFRAYTFFSYIYRWIFGRVMLWVEADVRSGLKMFRRSLLQSLRFDPQFDPRLGFDILLLYHARRVGWTIRSMRVPYSRPLFHHGVLGAFPPRISLAVGVVHLNIRRVLRTLFPFLYPPEPVEYFTEGFTNLNDYLFLSPTQSAKGHITPESISLAIVGSLVFVLCVAALKWATGSAVITIFALSISIMYIVLVLFKLFIMCVSIAHPTEEVAPEDLSAVDDADLPVVSVMIPLYKEREIIPQIFQYLLDFDYPQDKLDIIFILESTDAETAQAFLEMHPPAHFKALLSPDVQPKTKPKAMNVAFKVARGDILVIFDAEVIPERDQLKKAAVMFQRHPEAMYLHSKMDVYNAKTNWITRLYTGEFCYFYHYFLPGLVHSNYAVPISGHSTYFRRQVIERVGAWDAYNVAEDCDIGVRIYRKGFGSGMMLESHTWEQSTTTIPTWVRQRTRWIQGFIQTSIVQMRYPFLLKRELKSWKNFAVFLFLVPGNVLLNILNLMQWLMFTLWHTTHAPFLQIAYSGVTLYLSTFCFLVGNFMFTFYSMFALYRRKHYAIVPWGILSFVYWIMLGVATVRSALHLFLHPHKWDKTSHAAVTPKKNHAF